MKQEYNTRLSGNRLTIHTQHKSLAETKFNNKSCSVDSQLLPPIVSSSTKSIRRGKRVESVGKWIFNRNISKANSFICKKNNPTSCITSVNISPYLPQKNKYMKLLLMLKKLRKSNNKKGNFSFRSSVLLSKKGNNKSIKGNSLFNYYFKTRSNGATPTVSSSDQITQIQSSINTPTSKNAIAKLINSKKKNKHMQIERKSDIIKSLPEITLKENSKINIEELRYKLNISANETIFLNPKLAIYDTLLFPILYKITEPYFMLYEPYLEQFSCFYNK